MLVLDNVEDLLEEREDRSALMALLKKLASTGAIELVVTSRETLPESPDLAIVSHRLVEMEQEEAVLII